VPASDTSSAVDTSSDTSQVLQPYVRFRFMLDISVPVPGLRFRDAVPVGARQQFR
jgi:hypothetical protein